MSRAGAMLGASELEDHDMLQTTAATTATPAFQTDPSGNVLSINGRTVLLGIWDFAVAAADDANGLEGLQQFEVPPDTPADSLARQDVQRANGLLALQPRKCFDAFTAARNVNKFLYSELHRLTDKGFTGKALDEAMAPHVERAIESLRMDAADVYGAKERADALVKYARSTFPERKESEFQEVLFDAAIVGRLGTVNDGEKAQLRDGLLPARLADGRTVQAIFRTPPAMHGIDADMLELLQRAYAAAAWPCITQATTLVHSMVESARVAIASALMTCAHVGKTRNEEAFEKVAHGDWLAEARFLTLGDVSQAELLRQEKYQRALAGIFPQDDLPT